MKRHLMAIALASTALFAFTPVTNLASAAPVKEYKVTADVNKVTAITVPVTGTSVDGLSTFAGTFSISKFVTKNGQILANGTLVGTLTNTVTGLVQSVTQLVQIPVTAMSGSCQILHLELGPLDLDLLGLQVHLDRIVLDITAQSGQGNLLGNLLCAVANLLNSNGSLTAITQLLNHILGIVNIQP